MRRTIMVEGQELVPGQYLVKGALQWDSEIEYPVTNNFSHREVIGIGTDIRREEDNSITADVLFFDERWYGILGEDDSDVSIYSQPFTGHQWKNVWWISSATLKALAVVPYAFWPRDITK